MNGDRTVLSLKHTLLPCLKKISLGLMCRLLPAIMLVLGGCASLPNDAQRTESYALENTEDTHLGRSLAPLLAQHPGLSGFNILSSGQDALAARIALIQAAQRSLDLQYYIWHDDLAGRALHNQLLEAADRGVRAAPAAGRYGYCRQGNYTVRP